MSSTVCLKIKRYKTSYLTQINAYTCFFKIFLDQNEECLEANDGNFSILEGVDEKLFEESIHNLSAFGEEG